MNASRVASGVAVIVVALSLAAPARAEPPPADRAAAEALFQAARDLMKAGRYAEACPKLEESQRLDPGGGTLLNLGICHEGVGRTASAWVELQDAARLAREESRLERERIAREHLATVEPRLSRLTIVVAPAVAATVGLVVTLDGRPVMRPAWGVAVPADPGAHEITVEAPGHARVVVRVEVGVDRDVRTVTIADLPPPIGAATPVGTASAAAPVVVTGPATPSPSVDGTAGDGRGGLRFGAFVSLGVGAAGVVAGSVFGALAISKRHASDAHCTGDVCHDATGVALNDDAKRFALASDIAFGVGLAAAAAGVTLLVVASRAPDAPNAALMVRPGGAALRLDF